ncbi:MAG: nitroreductase family deazaflavin-dependent oxidoreductase [Pseudomonadales bacterium]|nr:nitroreductase family deazaflavin-dependent oxidoreductase [Pseudomonadales bacterium]
MSRTEYNKTVIDDFRANKGIATGALADMPLLIVTNKGARTGLIRENPLAYTMDKDRYIIIASFAGAAHSPPWYHNVVANPEVTVEVGEDKFIAKAEVMTEPERTRLYVAMAEKMPVFTEYQSKTSRIIPVLALTRVG